jgi:hypothetical protein
MHKADKDKARIPVESRGCQDARDKKGMPAFAVDIPAVDRGSKWVETVAPQLDEQPVNPTHVRGVRIVDQQPSQLSAGPVPVLCLIGQEVVGYPLLLFPMVPTTQRMVGDYFPLGRVMTCYIPKPLCLNFLYMGAIMIFNDQNRCCHAERSEASRGPSSETLRGVYPERSEGLRVTKYYRCCLLKIIIAHLHPPIGGLQRSSMWGACVECRFIEHVVSDSI